MVEVFWFLAGVVLVTPPVENALAGIITGAGVIHLTKAPCYGTMATCLETLTRRVFERCIEDT